MNRLDKLVLEKNSFKSLFATLLLTVTLILSGIINGCSNINPPDPPPNETSNNPGSPSTYNPESTSSPDPPPNGTSSNPGSPSTYKPERTVTFAEISTKLQSLGLEDAGSGVFVAVLRNPNYDYGSGNLDSKINSMLGTIGGLQVHLKRGDDLPAYETNHQVESVKFMVYSMGMTLNSDNKPIVQYSDLVKEKWSFEGGNQLIDKFWEAIKIWNELRYSGNSEELEAEIIKGIVASSNNDGEEVTELLGDSFNGYLSTKQLTPFGFIYVATTGYLGGGGVYVSF
jgi:hypothetical protein